VQLSALPEAFSYSHITLPAPIGATGTSRLGHTLARRDLFDVRFQLSLSETHPQPDDQTAARRLISGTYKSGLKTWECALDLAVYLVGSVLGAQAGVAAG